MANRLILVLVTAFLMLLMLLDWTLAPIRVLFAIALVTILPGYALTSAIFINTPLGIMEKIAFSCGFSLGLTSLGGLLLNYTDWGIQSISWLTLLGGITLLTSMVVIARMKNDNSHDVKVVRDSLAPQQLILMILAVAILSGAYLYARAGAEHRSLPPTTRVWILWADDSQTEVVLGVQNQETVPVQYRLQLSGLQGQIQEWSPIALEAGSTWEIKYDTPPVVAESDLIKVTLYRLDSPEKSYREVYLRRIMR